MKSLRRHPIHNLLSRWFMYSNHAKCKLKPDTCKTKTRRGWNLWDVIQFKPDTWKRKTRRGWNLWDVIRFKPDTCKTKTRRGWNLWDVIRFIIYCHDGYLYSNHAKCKHKPDTCKTKTGLYICGGGEGLGLKEEEADASGFVWLLSPNDPLIPLLVMDSLLHR